tara:strand:+ start:210 stop:1655 length:1446 start_codon:yes stop_codon:yes gene_type:complete
MAVAEKNILDRPGKYNLSELNIISYQQVDNQPRFIDIKGITLTLSITEDIFSNNIMGSIIVYDTQDIRTMLPLTGLERLSFKLNTPGLPGYDMSEDTGVPFQIYKVDSVRKDEQSDVGQFYKIYFCSPEMYYNQLASVSRAYAGPIEDAVTDIVRQKKYLNSKKALFVEKTATNSKYVIPSLKPYQAISYLAKQAVSGKYNNAGYLFYENAKGFHFRSLGSLLALGGARARPTVWNYMTQLTNVQDGQKPEVKDIQRRLQTILKYEIGKPVDTLANMVDGMYANKLVVHDAFNKTLKTHNFNFKDNYEKEFHTETIGDSADSDKMITPIAQLNDTNSFLYDGADSKKMVVAETSKVHNDYEFTPTNLTLPKIVSQMAQYRNMGLSILAHGYTMLNAGDIINFTEPVRQPGDKKPNNPYTSGRYLVMAIKHTLSVETQTHTMVLKCFKDSVRTPLPSEEDGLFVGREDNTNIDIYKEDEKIA